MDSFANECMVQSVSENGEFDARTKGEGKRERGGKCVGKEGSLDGMDGRKAWIGLEVPH